MLAALLLPAVPVGSCGVLPGRAAPHLRMQASPGVCAMCGEGWLARNANKTLAVRWEKGSADALEGSGDAKNHLGAQLRVIKTALSRVFS